MTKEDRDILITTCLLRTNYAEEFFENLSDTELLDFYENHVEKRIHASLNK